MVAEKARARAAGCVERTAGEWQKVSSAFFPFCSTLKIILSRNSPFDLELPIKATFFRSVYLLLIVFVFLSW